MSIVTSDVPILLSKKWKDDKYGLTPFVNGVKPL